MALSDNAIGFYLEVEDVSLTSTLKGAAKAYDDYTRALEKYNKRAYDSSSKGLGQIQSLVKAMDDLPQTAARAAKGASAAIERQLRPITQKIDLSLSSSAETKLRRVIGKAVTEAMSDARVRLSASLPQRRLGMFQQGAGLRAQYSDVIQPPDMRGRIQPLKKFNKGGIVDGPEGIDKVLALLTKNEMVIPADVTKDLLKAAGGNLRKASGSFAPAKDIGEMVADVTNLANALEKMKGGLEAGLGTEREFRMYKQGVETLTKRVDQLTESQNDLSFSTKVRLSPTILQATKRLEDFKDEGGETGTVMEGLLGKILGPARFIAITKAIDSMQDGLSSLRAGAGSAFTTLGGDEITSGIESMNRMNQFLGISREELRQIKIRAGEVASEVDGITFDELGNGLRIAAELGIRNEDTMFNLAKAATTAAKATDIAQESAVELGFELTHSLNMSQKGFEDTIGSISQLSDRTSGFNISANKLFGQTAADVRVLNTSLRQLSDEESQRLIGSFNQIGAVLESNFIQAGDLRQVLARAFEGGPENMDAIRTAAHLTGLAQDDLREKLLSGDMEGIFDRIGAQVQRLDPAQIKALAGAVGISSDELGKLGGSLDNINEGFAKSKTRIVDTGDGLQILQDRASANRTAFERLQEGFTDFVASTSLFGVNGAEALDLLKEFNVTSLASSLYLGKMALSGMGALKGLLGLGGAAGTVTPVLGKAGSVVSKVGPMVGRLLPMLGHLGPMLAKVATTAGPLMVVAGAAAFVTRKMIDLSNEAEAANKIADKGDKAALTDFGSVGADIMRVRKNIARVQRTVDLDAERGAVNETAVAMLERYNAQLADLEARSKGMVEMARANQNAGVPTDPQADVFAGMDPQDFAFDPSTTYPGGITPVTADEMAQLMPAAADTEKQEKLLERMVMLMEEQVRATRESGATVSPSKSAHSPSTGVSPFGQLIAGGGL